MFQGQTCLCTEGTSCGGADAHGKVWTCELFALQGAVSQGWVPGLQGPLGSPSHLQLFISDIRA